MPEAKCKRCGETRAELGRMKADLDSFRDSVATGGGWHFHLRFTKPDGAMVFQDFVRAVRGDFPHLGLADAMVEHARRHVTGQVKARNMERFGPDPVAVERGGRSRQGRGGK